MQLVAAYSHGMSKPYIRFSLAAILIFAAAVLLAPLVMRFVMDPFVYVSTQEIPQTEVAVVLGASVARGLPSPILAKRADAAIALYHAGKVKKILVTGDNAELNYDEVTPVRRYLIQAGIPADDVFLDHAGFDTYSSMYRARDIFQAQSMTIVTQDFHMPRALYIARHLGMTAYGFMADGEGGLTGNYLREMPACVKALWDLWSNRLPRYLGPVIPLDGPGMVTWY